MEIRKNESFVVTIEDMSDDGAGIGKLDGYIWFIKDTVTGDVVEAKSMKMKKSYGYARLVKVLRPSEDRVEPVCPVARQCGGCQLQTLSYEKQLEFKDRKIRDSLTRIGGFAPEYVDSHIEPIVGMEEPFRYRNKAQYPVVPGCLSQLHYLVQRQYRKIDDRKYNTHTYLYRPHPFLYILFKECKF